MEVMIEINIPTAKEMRLQYLKANDLSLSWLLKLERELNTKIGANFLEAEIILVEEEEVIDRETHNLLMIVFIKYIQEDLGYCARNTHTGKRLRITWYKFLNNPSYA